MTIMLSNPRPIQFSTTKDSIAGDKPFYSTADNPKQPKRLRRRRRSAQQKAAAMDSSQVKQAVMKQVQQEANLVNARALIEVRPPQLD